MTSDEFRNLIVERTDTELLGPCLRDEIVPYVFDPDPTAWDTFRVELAAQLGVSRGDITVVGSGRLGYSMKPWTEIVAFKDTSDIDVVIVNSTIFDEVWLSLLRVAYPRPPVTDTMRSWLGKRKNEIYTGWITPMEIHLDRRIYGAKAKPVLDFKALWFNALQHVSQYPPRRHESVEGRLYRTWSHAELYHLYGLGELRKALIG